ncbi:universal stress protein [Streptacidiphilus sp. MAP5-3]|uniref:universal stress protein n=1 Tax=unclassified Streptacidiphilus TaxID=2643834 RepID=UPI003512E28C
MAGPTGCVVVGVDGGAGGVRALRLGARLARESGLPLIGVLAWTPTAAARSAFGGERLRACERTAMARLDRTCHQVLDEVASCDAKLIPFVARGRAGRVLLDVADAADDVLVLGSHRPEGRTARYCLAHARCSVVTVPRIPERAADRAAQQIAVKGAPAER